MPDKTTAQLRRHRALLRSLGRWHLFRCQWRAGAGTVAALYGSCARSKSRGRSRNAVYRRHCRAIRSPGDATGHPSQFRQATTRSVSVLTNSRSSARMRRKPEKSTADIAFTYRLLRRGRLQAQGADRLRRCHLQSSLDCGICLSIYGRRSFPVSATTVLARRDTNFRSGVGLRTGRR